MKGLAIHFRPRQTPSQFSWTLSKTILRLWVLLPNTIPSYPSPLPLPIIHLRCFMPVVYGQHHQIKSKITSFISTPYTVKILFPQDDRLHRKHEDWNVALAKKKKKIGDMFLPTI
jgi:hypothetical protein